MSRDSIPALDPSLREQINSEVQRLQPLRAGFPAVRVEEEAPGVGLVTLDELRAIAGLQNLFFDHLFSSHRPVIGPLIVFCKRTVIAVLNRLLKISLVRQVELNQHLWNLAQTVYHLEGRLQRLEQAHREAASGKKAL